MSDTQQGDWTKPAAMAIPKGGVFKDKVEQGRYGPIFPKTRRATASRSSRRSSPGGRRSSTSMPRRSRRRWPASRTVLAVLKLHYLRWVLFAIKGETYFMYQGIFDTDFDKYTEDAVAIFSQYGHQYGLRKPRRLSRRTGRRTPRRSSSSSASTSARASWNTASTPM